MVEPEIPRYRLEEGKLHPDPEGRWVQWESVEELLAYPAAVKEVLSWYPHDVFPDEIDEGKTEAERRCRTGGKMARITCNNIERLVKKYQDEKGA